MREEPGKRKIAYLIGSGRDPTRGGDPVLTSTARQTRARGGWKYAKVGDKVEEWLGKAGLASHLSVNRGKKSVVNRIASRTRRSILTFAPLNLN